VNSTYTPLTNISETADGYTALTVQPGGPVFPQISADGVVNGTIFVAITDSNPFLTAHNFSFINAHVVAGPTIYQAG